MKQFLIGIIQSSAKWLLSALVAVAGAYFAVETWVDTKVEAAEVRVMFIRKADMEHLNKRFDTIERLIMRIDR